jgi:DNA-binding transcriptional ArsR family regulator/uncharacterized protein YndB with AHSA1/START domain
MKQPEVLPATAAEQNEQLVSVWSALSDPTRRAILDLLRENPRTTGELANLFPQSRFAIMKHLNVLESAGLVLVRRHGRERWNHLNAIPMQLLYDRWVKPYQAHWASRMTNLKSTLEGDTKALKTLTLEQVELEISIKAPLNLVWKSLTEETTFWWSKDFYTSERTKAFRLEPTLGGKMYEDCGEGAGVIWYEVFAIDPPRSIDLRGFLAVPYGPGLSLLHLELLESGNETVLKLSDSTMGALTDGGKAKSDGWKHLFADGLKQYVETRLAK